MISILSDSIQTKNDENQFHRMLTEMSVTSQSEAARISLNSLIKVIENESNKESKEVIRSMEVLHKEAPELYERIRGFSESCIAGVVGNSIYSWMLPIINAMPK